MRKRKLTPAVRIDGAKRTNLAEQRRRRQASANAAPVAPKEDTRVADVWRREELRSNHASQTAPIRRRSEKLLHDDGGKDGAKLTNVKVRISSERSERQTIRSRPGTFEWRYGRRKQDVLFHAGSHLAILWERAGIALASSADFLRGTGSGYAAGISDGRVAAIDKLDGFVKELGRAPASRLVDYCVAGLTTAQIAAKHGAKEREMAPVLHHDLRACAQHFNFLTGNLC